MHRRVLGILQLFRLELPFVAGICVLIGEILALGKFPSFEKQLFGFISVFFISSASIILNDYFDYKIDLINAPNRPLPSGRVSKKDVLILFIITTMIGLVVAYFINYKAFFVAIIVWMIGFLYNWKIKRTGLLGNILVSISVGMTFTYGGIIVGKPVEGLVLYFAIISFLINLGEEISGDSIDMQGDMQIGSKSLAILKGQSFAFKTSALIFIVVIIASLIPIILGWLPQINIIPILIMDVIIMYSIIKLVDIKKKNKHKYIRLIYISASISAIIFIIIRLLS